MLQRRAIRVVQVRPFSFNLHLWVRYVCLGPHDQNHVGWRRPPQSTILVASSKRWSGVSHVCAAHSRLAAGLEKCQRDRWSGKWHLTWRAPNLKILGSLSSKYLQIFLLSTFRECSHVLGLEGHVCWGFSKILRMTYYRSMPWFLSEHDNWGFLGWYPFWPVTHCPILSCPHHYVLVLRLSLSGCLTLLSDLCDLGL